MIQIGAQFSQRMPDELHAEVKEKAAEMGMSVNGYINHILAKQSADERLTVLERQIAEHELRIREIETKK